jgi:hypothetical protein
MASSDTHLTAPVADETGPEVTDYDYSDYMAELELRERAGELCRRFNIWGNTGTLTPPHLKYRVCRSAAKILLKSEENDETIAKARSMVEEIDANPRRAFSYGFTFGLRSLDRETAAKVAETTKKAVKEREAREKTGDGEKVVEGGVEVSQK